MLRLNQWQAGLLRRLSVVVTTVAVVAACGRAAPPQPVLPPLSDSEGMYELRFNDKLVGEVFFALDIDDGGHYRIDAFTRPADDILATAGQEIVEFSEGSWIDGNVRPQEFGHSARDEDGVEGLTFRFDWQDGSVNLDNGEQRETVDLPEATQDRLSYLLLARQLAIHGGEQVVRIIGPQGAEEATLRALGRRDIDVPGGSFSAAGVARLGPDQKPQREIWFSDAEMSLPLIVTQHHGDNRVDMRLTHYEAGMTAD